MITAPRDEKCPDQETLVKFLQGKLVPPDLDQCESHVEICDNCHDTLRGLNPSDTLSEYVSKAMQPSEAFSDDAAVVENLVRRLVQSDIGSDITQNRIGANEVMHDRAAEVLRYVSPDPEDSESLGMLAGFRLLELIGAGGTGVVFRAHDLALDRVVALKVLRPSLGEIARDRFVAEARAAASIDHENVVTIYQVGQQDRLAWIAMRWLPGETLESLLLREGPLEESQVRSFAIQIAQGLEAAHGQQLVHRDIKPANIWIGEPDRKIRILDFGLVRITDSDPNLTATGMLAGTPNFMSPEQAKGQELDARSDLFSLGCVIYQMLTGRLPFGSPTILATLQAIQTQQPPSPIEAGACCDEELSDLTLALLEKQPANRIPAAEALVKCLQQERKDWPVRVTRYPSKSISRFVETAPAMQKSKGGRGFWVAALLLGMIALPMWLFAPQIIRVVTNQGELVIETEDKNVKVEVRENGDLIRVLDTSSGSSFDVRSGNYEFSAVSDGDGKTSFEVTPSQVVMSRGEREIVRVTRSEKTPAVRDSAQAPTDRGVDPGRVERVYAGRTFRQWLRVARTDKEPKTKANAITACGELCESDEQIKEFKGLLNEFLADHASLIMGVEGSKSGIYQRGFFAAFATLSVADVVGFVESQVRDGSDEALFWTGFAFNQSDFFERGHKYDQELDAEFKSKAMSLLEIFPQRKTHRGSQLIFNRLLKYLDQESEHVAEKVTSILLASPPSLRRELYTIDYPRSLIDERFMEAFESDLLSPKSTPEIRDEVLWGIGISYRPQPAEDFRPELEMGILERLLVDQLTNDSPLAFTSRSKMETLNGAEFVDRSFLEGGGFGAGGLSKKFEGPVVVARRVLNMVAMRIEGQFKFSGKYEMAAKIAPAIRKILSHETYLQSKKSDAFVTLQIDQDLNAVLDFAAGKAGSSFGSFTSAQWLRFGDLPVSRRRLQTEKAKKDAQAAVSSEETSDAKSVYSGKTYKQWLEIARTDKDPKTKTDAMEACGELCESDEQIKEFKALLNDFLVEYASLPIGEKGSKFGIYQTGFFSALATLSAADFVDFVESQVRDGSDEALYWTGLAFNQNDFSDPTHKNYQELDAEFKANAMPLLESFAQRKDNVGSALMFRCVLSFLDKSSAEIGEKVSAILSASSPSLRRDSLYEIPRSAINDRLMKSFEGDFFSPESSLETRDELLLCFERYCRSQQVSGLRTEHEMGVLTTLLVDQLTADSPLTFDSYSRIMILEGRAVGVNRDPFGRVKGIPENAKQFQGGTVVARRLIDVIANQIKTQGTSELAEKIAPAIKRILSHEKYLQSKESAEFVKLQIDQDLNAFLEFAAGKESEFGSIAKSYESPQQRQSQQRQGGGVF